MIEYKGGNIFQASVDTLVVPTNCVGVMGKGLSLEYKNKFPEMFSDYRIKCKVKKLTTRTPYIWDIGKSKKIFVLASRNNWSDKVNLIDVAHSFLYLANNYKKLGIKSIAIPAIGCGSGGVKWEDLKKVIDKIFEKTPELIVEVYAPISEI
jgi:O-acetyl-ADP-ribose deacetylase (regulator of RNase III)